MSLELAAYWDALIRFRVYERALWALGPLIAFYSFYDTPQDAVPPEPPTDFGFFPLVLDRLLEAAAPPPYDDADFYFLLLF